MMFIILFSNFSIFTTMREIILPLSFVPVAVLPAKTPISLIVKFASGEPSETILSTCGRKNKGKARRADQIG